MNSAVKLNYVVQGNGPCVLICHGLYGSLANFGGLAKILEKNHTVIRVDLRNHGKSPHVHSMALRAMANDLALVLDQENVRSAVLIGHSLGGKVAMEFAQLNPRCVSGLIIVDIAPVQYAMDSHANVFNALQAVDLSAVKNRKDADAMLAMNLADASLRQFLLTNLQRSKDGYEWRINLPVLISEYGNIAASPSELPAYIGTTCIIRGSESDYVTDDMRDVIRSRFPRAVIKTINGAGHWLHAEKPQEFSGLVQDFLRRLEPSG